MDSRLRTACEMVTLQELHTKQFQEILEGLLTIVYGDNNKGEGRNTNKAMCVGLSANQVGVLKQISIVDLAIGNKGYSDIHVLINPHIVWKSKTLVKHPEGCMNLHTIWGEVKRSQRVKVEAFDRSGNKILLDAHGWPSVLLQHEIDHLQGTLFIDHLEDPTHAHLVNDGEYKKYKKEKENWQQFIDVSDLVK